MEQQCDIHILQIPSGVLLPGFRHVAEILPTTPDYTDYSAVPTFVVRVHVSSLGPGPLVLAGPLTVLGPDWSEDSSRPRTSAVLGPYRSEDRRRPRASILLQARLY
jgi:hypothetical protein